MPIHRQPDYVFVLILSQAAAAAYAAVRLLHFGLRRRFPFLFVYLLLVAADLLPALLFPLNSHIYYVLYIGLMPALWCAQGLAAREMFSLIFRDYPGIQSTGRWAVYVALSLAVVISVTVAFAWKGQHTNYSYYQLILDRSVDFSLAVIVVALMTSLSRYPLRLDRNTLVSSAFFGGIFMTEAAAKLLDSLSRDLFVRTVDFIQVGIAALCFAGWGIFLQPAGASKRSEKTPNTDHEIKLLHELETINRLLSRAGRS